jgi:hypothetical protein
MKKMVRISYGGGFDASMECAGMNNPSRNDDPSHLRVPKEPHDERNNFYNSTNALWSLYESEVESSDKVRIKALKEDMDVILIFVRTHHLPSVVSWFDFILILGRSILGCHHCFRCPQDSGSESKLCGPISLLPATIRSDSRSNITTTRVE